LAGFVADRPQEVPSKKMKGLHCASMVPFAFHRAPIGEKYSGDHCENEKKTAEAYENENNHRAFSSSHRIRDSALYICTRKAMNPGAKRRPTRSARSMIHWSAKNGLRRAFGRF
jgi:hypothetical protein